jgi:hypothetical protein
MHVPIDDDATFVEADWMTDETSPRWICPGGSSVTFCGPCARRILVAELAHLRYRAVEARPNLALDALLGLM